MRDVYFDPFGSYTQGYDRGTARQMDMEAATRQARDSDYKYNVLNPYELKSIQREDRFGDATQNGRLKLFNDTVDTSGNTLYNQNLGIAQNFAHVTGIGAPAANLLFGRQHYTFGNAPTGGVPTTVPQGYTAPATGYAPQAPAAELAPYNVPQNTQALPRALDYQNGGYAPAPSGDAGSAFLQRVKGLGRPPTQEEVTTMGTQIAAQYGITPQALMDMANKAAQPTPVAAPPYAQYTNPSHPDQMVNPAYYPQTAAPAAAPVTQYNIPQGAQYNLPQAAGMPLPATHAAPTYVYDQNGNLVSAIPDLNENIVADSNYAQIIADRTYRQSQMDSLAAAQRARDEIIQKYVYGNVVDRQTAAHRGTNDIDALVLGLFGPDDSGATP